MVAELSIQDRYYMEHICCCGGVGIDYRVVDSELSGSEIGASEPGEIVANGVMS